MAAIIIGADQTSHSVDVNTNESWSFFWEPFVASASGTLVTLGINTTATNACVLAIYDNSSPPNGNLLGSTAQFNLPGTATSQFLQTPVNITSGTTYNLVGFIDTSYPFVYGDTSSSSIIYKQSGLTFPTLPNPLVSNNTNNGSPILALWGATTNGNASLMWILG